MTVGFGASAAYLLNEADIAPCGRDSASLRPFLSAGTEKALSLPKLGVHLISRAIRRFPIMAKQDKSRLLRLDERAESASSHLPAFLARPENAPIYHGFPVVEETRTDGWCFGAITEFEDPNGCDSGDGFVIAPDDSRAGLVWDVGKEEISQIAPPEPGRWGVYQIWFPKPVFITADLVENFRAVLPKLQRIYGEIRGQSV